MKAAIFKGPGTIAVEERPKPTISEPTDAVVRVVLACVCGSDLWYYRGESDHPVGSIGHEFIGVVDEIGADVSTVAVGDFVIAPFAWSDGVCKNCEAGFHTACIHGGFFGRRRRGRRRPSRVRPGAAGRRHPRPGSRHGFLGRDDGLAARPHRCHEYRLPRCGQRRRQAGRHRRRRGRRGGRVVRRPVGQDARRGAHHRARQHARRSAPARPRVGRHRHHQCPRRRSDQGAARPDRRLWRRRGAGVRRHEGRDGHLLRHRAAGAVVGRVGVPHGVNIDAEGTFYRNVGMRAAAPPRRGATSRSCSRPCSTDGSIRARSST